MSDQRAPRAHPDRDAKRTGRRTLSAPSSRARTGDPSRYAAYQVMRAVSAGAYANLEMPRHLRRVHLSGRDAAFATELVYGSTRWRGFYDLVISRCAGRPIDAIDEAVLDTLRLGAHQLLGMRVRTHAAVGETVALSREVNGGGAAGFVNAVLRRISEKDLPAWQYIVVPTQDETARLAALFSHPEWVVRAFRAALLAHGTATADDIDEQLEALLEADNTPAEVSLVARPGVCDLDELLRAGATPSEISPVGARLSGGDPGGLAAIRDGRAAVQDEGSQLLTLALIAAPIEPLASGGDAWGGDASGGDTSGGDTSHDAPEVRWLDLCAGPGGKAGLLAALALREGAVLYANDISEHRADLVGQAVRAVVDAGGDVRIGTGDGRTIGAEEPDSFDRVLVDAPCTGLGALRRRPEARWRRTPDDVATLAQLQRELLTSAVDAARPGGLIGYATCSPLAAETTYVVEDVVKRHGGVEVLDAQPFFTDAAGEPITRLGTAPYAQLWPHLHGTDAMFFALLRKR